MNRLKISLPGLQHPPRHLRRRAFYAGYPALGGWGCVLTLCFRSIVQLWRLRGILMDEELFVRHSTTAASNLTTADYYSI